MDDINDTFDVILLDGQEYETTKKLLLNNKDAITIIDAGRPVDTVIELAKLCKYVVCSKTFAEGVSKIKDDYIKMYKKLEEIFEDKIDTNEEIIMYAKKLQEMGAQNVLISLGKEGAILITKDHNVLYSKAPKGVVVNSVGAGDSMVAGFLAGLLIHDDYEKAFKMGIAAGTASTFSENLATKDEILYQFSKL